MFFTMITRAAFVLVLSLASACNPRADASVSGGDATGGPSTTILGRAVPVSVTITVETLVTRDRGLAAIGAAYEAGLMARVLPDGAPTAPITLAASDTIDTTNYRAEGWWMGHNDGSARGRWRFSLDFARFTSGVVVLRLDTLLERLLGLVPHSTPELWMAPRSAWFVDTVRSRIRRIRPDALSCWLAADPD